MDAKKSRTPYNSKIIARLESFNRYKSRLVQLTLGLLYPNRGFTSNFIYYIGL
jgi:hypothetical protein